MLQSIKTILIEDDNVRLDRYIRRIFPDLKQSVIEKSLRKGLIKVDDCKAKSSDRVNSGQTITLKHLNYIENANSDRKYNEKLVNLLRENILYEDEYILAINKPAGVIVQGGVKVKISMSDLLDQIREGETFKIVHRLDRDTSGVIIFARNANVARYLMEEFKGRRVKKTYLALTSGIPSKDSGTIDYPLVKKYVSGQEKVVVDENSPQNATTHFSIIAKSKHNVAYLKLQPITGRTHQLRAHLAHINCPILGDGKYGGKKAFIDGIANKIHLHSHSLSLKLPNNKEITITAPITKHIEKSIEALFFD
ncbi:RluA family pseudouridine synthase [Wolbachia endosymbiont of Carposina sasakii]|jgi:23S rRNA pseudouridine955/2504/2580 synthase|uniref:ribosomal large subunit pseudouridine synthase C-like n=1 Tax=Euwallacea similis TaxID=1736056 RepID=UPI00004CA6FC|nr:MULTISPECIES: RluA family pseudouridine synthase [Wolbachia]MDU8941149.1 RluA family pseudouridine synthase [Wolbachia endosymbiont of Drosophila malagassya]MDX5487238.1 RluA family pseudouridine synthase [Wolbachia endosymbiont of Andrena praecox]MDX5497001.1 RluA family pseudouridine synthase [Wolbachia endosymbiont of Nomada fabriciana]MDX5497908.1 RluA family pseudouridine synthase [Wolbachia endosymbiont of Lasioglossum nitidulum]MDX5508075.1 RluA family pseudouridine synthase [Wolbach